MPRNLRLLWGCVGHTRSIRQSHQWVNAIIRSLHIVLYRIDEAFSIGLCCRSGQVSAHLRSCWERPDHKTSVPYNVDKAEDYGPRPVWPVEPRVQRSPRGDSLFIFPPTEQTMPSFRIIALVAAMGFGLSAASTTSSSCSGEQQQQVQAQIAAIRASRV